MDSEIISHQQYLVFWPLLTHLFEEDLELLLIDGVREGLIVFYAILSRSSNYNCSWSIIQLFHVHQHVCVW